MGKAVAYMQSEWPRLRVYLEDGQLSIDNAPVENAIRPFAVGRVDRDERVVLLHCGSGLKYPMPNDQVSLGYGTDVD